MSTYPGFLEVRATCFYDVHAMLPVTHQEQFTDYRLFIVLSFENKHKRRVTFRWSELSAGASKGAKEAKKQR